MKPTRRVAVALLLVCALLPGCFTVHTWAPEGRSITMLPKDAPVEYSDKYKQWYLFWGLWKITGKNPVDVVEEQNLAEVRFMAEDRLEDGLLGFAYFLVGMTFLPMPQSVIVEGNYAPGGAPAAQD